MKIIEHYQPQAIPVSKQTEKISVAVAVYNSEAYLDRTIQSILGQTYRNLEIILVDDGSTDGCPAICDKYAQADSRVKVIHKKNGGLFTSRNVGMEHATGEYLAFMDGDDWIDPEMYEHMLSALKDQDADLAVCRYKWVYQDETVDISTNKAVVFEGQEILEKYLEEDDAVQIQNAAWNKLYKRSILGDLAYPPRWYEDMLYTIQLLNLPAKSVYLDHAYHNYICDRSTSIMNKGINKRIFTDLIPNLYDRSSFLRSIGREDLALLQDYFMYKRLMLFYMQVYRSDDPLKKEHLAFLEEKIRAGKPMYEKIYSIPQAKPKEYRNIRLFVRSPRLFVLKMKTDDAVVIPLKVKIYRMLKRG